MDHVESIADYEKVGFRRNQVESDGIIQKFLQKWAETWYLKLFDHAELIGDHENVTFRQNQLELNRIFSNLQYEQAETSESSL